MTQQPEYFLAIDAGGTKTDLLLADSSTELARVRTGSIKLLNTQPAIAEENLATALAELEGRAGVRMLQLTRTCIGASGFSVPLVAGWLRDQFAQRTAGELLLCGDEEIALDAAFPGGGGVLVLAGTGSNAVGRMRDGTLTRAGGWGPILADEGSGHWIGLHAVRSIFRALDEGRTTLLLPEVQRAWQLASLEALIQLGNAMSAPKFAELAPVVLACAAQGDAIAVEVLQQAASELARLAAIVLERMRIQEGPGSTLPPVAFAGSILSSVAPVREGLLSALERQHPGIDVHPDPADPLLGALWRARTSPRTR